MYSIVLCRKGLCSDPSYANIYCIYKVYWYSKHIQINLTFFNTGRSFWLRHFVCFCTFRLHILLPRTFRLHFIFKDENNIITPTEFSEHKLLTSNWLFQNSQIFIYLNSKYCLCDVISLSYCIVLHASIISACFHFFNQTCNKTWFFI